MITQMTTNPTTLQNPTTETDQERSDMSMKVYEDAGLAVTLENLLKELVKDTRFTQLDMKTFEKIVEAYNLSKKVRTQLEYAITKVEQYQD